MKTDEDLAVEYSRKYKDPLHVAVSVTSFLAGYEAAKDYKFKDNVRSTYNDHKLKEAEETIKKLHGRLGELTLRFDNVSVILTEVESLCKQWHSDDQVFEHHSKVGPWAGFFPVKKND
jgi:hypothetical protein